MPEASPDIPHPEQEADHELTLPADRAPGDFQVGERVIILAPESSTQRNLKFGTIEQLSRQGKRVTVRLDSPPRLAVRPAADSSNRGTFSANIDQPILMTEADYAVLRSQPERIDGWVQSGLLDDRLRQELKRKLEGVGVSDAVVAPIGFEIALETSPRPVYRRR